jgi:hypothetical protein
LFLLNYDKPDQEPHTEPGEAPESFAFTLLTKTRSETTVTGQQQRFKGGTICYSGNSISHLVTLTNLTYIQALSSAGGSLKGTLRRVSRIVALLGVAVCLSHPVAGAQDYQPSLDSTKVRQRHRSATTTNPHILIEVNKKAVSVHIDHGDLSPGANNLSCSCVAVVPQDRDLDGVPEARDYDVTIASYRRANRGVRGHCEP